MTTLYPLAMRLTEQKEVDVMCRRCRMACSGWAVPKSNRGITKPLTRRAGLEVGRSKRSTVAATTQESLRMDLQQFGWTS
jgi:hypothetical protein